MSGKIILFIACIALTACSQRSEVTLNYKNGNVIVTGIDAVTLGGLRRDTLNQEAWENLLPVRRMPADKETKDDQPPLHGRYVINDTAVVFKPDTPFRKGRDFFARYYRFDKPITNWDLILKRRELAKAPYVELEFKP